MRILVQRVQSAHVDVDGKTVGKIQEGALVFFAVHKDDVDSSISWLASKLCHLRMFSDENEKMNLSLKDIKKEVLIVSQFTLYGNCEKGRRPSFTESLEGPLAKGYYESFIKAVKEEGIDVETGIFGAKMQVHLINDGPVTFLIER